MLTYLKIIGPPVLKAIKALERMTVDFPSVCIMNTIISYNLPNFVKRDVSGVPMKSYHNTTYTSDLGFFSREHFKSNGISLNEERCNNIISESGHSLGEYDFFFEWFKNPGHDELMRLIDKIDESLTPIKCYYTIVHKA